MGKQILQPKTVKTCGKYVPFLDMTCRTKATNVGKKQIQEKQTSADPQI